MHLAVDQVMHKWQPQNIAAALIQALGFEAIDAFEQGMQQALLQRTQRCIENTTTATSSKDLSTGLTMDDRHHYLLELSGSEASLLQIFAPFIAAALNQKTVYIAAAHQRTELIYAQYFKLAALAQHRTHALAQMHLDVDLVDLSSLVIAPRKTENQAQLQQHDCAVQQQHLIDYALARACLDPACEAIYLRGDVYLSQQDRDAFYTAHAIHLHCLKSSAALATEDCCVQHQVDFKRLFCKVKTQHAAQVCQQMAKVNAAFISQITQLNLTQSELFIEDLLYSEHVFEKLSVFSEFTETLLTRQLSA